MQVREMVTDDLPAVIALLGDDELGHRREAPDGLDAYRQAFAAIDADPNHVLAVLDDAGEVVGTLQLSFLPNLTHQGSWRAQVEGVRVANDRRGEGLDRVLFDWAIEEARARGCRLVQLTTDRRRPEAHRFYESLGFVPSHVGMKLTLASVGCADDGRTWPR